MEDGATDVVMPEVSYTSIKCKLKTLGVSEDFLKHMRENVVPRVSHIRHEATVFLDFAFKALYIHGHAGRIPLWADPKSSDLHTLFNVSISLVRGIKFTYESMSFEGAGEVLTLEECARRVLPPYRVTFATVKDCLKYIFMHHYKSDPDLGELVLPKEPGRFSSEKKESKSSEEEESKSSEEEESKVRKGNFCHIFHDIGKQLATCTTTMWATTLESRLAKWVRRSRRIKIDPDDNRHVREIINMIFNPLHTRKGVRFVEVKTKKKNKKGKSTKKKKVWDADVPAETQRQEQALVLEARDLLGITARINMIPTQHLAAVARYKANEEKKKLKKQGNLPEGEEVQRIKNPGTIESWYGNLRNTVWRNTDTAVAINAQLTILAAAEAERTDEEIKNKTKEEKRFSVFPLGKVGLVHITLSDTTIKSVFPKTARDLERTHDPGDNTAPFVAAAALFDKLFPKLRKTVGKRRLFARCIKTDGYSASVAYTPKGKLTKAEKDHLKEQSQQKKKEEKRQRANRKRKRGSNSAKQTLVLKNKGAYEAENVVLGRGDYANVDIVGIDPGRDPLAVCCNVTEVMKADAEDYKRHKDSMETTTDPDATFTPSLSALKDNHRELSKHHLYEEASYIGRSRKMHTYMKRKGLDVVARETPSLKTVSWDSLRAAIRQKRKHDAMRWFAHDKITGDNGDVSFERRGDAVYGNFAAGVRCNMDFLCYLRKQKLLDSFFANMAKESRKKGKKLIIAFGAASFTHNGGGQKTGLKPKGLIDVAKRHAIVILCNEYFTSQACADCVRTGILEGKPCDHDNVCDVDHHARHVTKTKKIKEYNQDTKEWKTKKETKTRRTKVFKASTCTTRHSGRTVDRDLYAAFNIGYIARSTLWDEPRPTRFKPIPNTPSPA